MFQLSALNKRANRINGANHTTNVANNTITVVTAAFLSKCFAFWK